MTPSGPVPSTLARPAEGPADHVRLGVGARFTLAPAADDPVPVILGALDAARHAVPEVGVRTDDVSTLVRGSEQDLARYLTAAVAHAARSTPSGHLVAMVALSRGCPGEAGCELPVDELVEVPSVAVSPVGLRAAAHWALYPLGTTDAMAPIGRAIDLARGGAAWGGPESFVTRLDGDLGAVVSTLVDTWTTVGRDVAHVTAHATLVLGSPTVDGAAR